MYYDAFNERNVLNYLSKLSDDMRNELFEKAKKEHEKRYEFTRKIFTDCNALMTFAEDFSTYKKGHGDKYVYGWFNENGELFYIGQGVNTRVVQNKLPSRTNYFMERAGEHPFVCIFAKDVNEEWSLDMEKILIWMAQVNNEPITNMNGLLDASIAKEIWMLDNGMLNLEECYPGTREKYKEYTNLAETYYEAVRAYKKIMQYMSEKYGHTQAGWGDGQEKNFKAVRHNSTALKWTIDGDTRPRKEWCRLYNTSPTIVMDRMKTMDLGLKEALTYIPYVSDTKNKNYKFYAMSGR